VYLLTLLIFQLTALGKPFGLLKIVSLVPLAFYALAVVMQTLASIPANGVVRSCSRCRCWSRAIFFMGSVLARTVYETAPRPAALAL